MPELYWEHGYLTVISVMMLIASSLFIFFWRMGLLGNLRRPPKDEP